MVSVAEQDSHARSVVAQYEEGWLGTGKNIVLSVQPKYVKLIMGGTKTVELRRRFATRLHKGTLDYIYSTRPTQALAGTVRIQDVNRIPVSEIWERHAQGACVERQAFEAYFTGLDEGIVIHLSDVRHLRRAVGLQEFRERFNFVPRQSFMYANSLLDAGLLE